MRKGEVYIDSINSVEDTKGNNGDRGNLIISNLRVIWFGEENPSLNLSIGYDTIMFFEIKQSHSILKGPTQSLYIKAISQGCKYEFIFTSLVKNSPRLFSSFQAVIRSYNSTKIYRETKLRGAISRERNLIVLPQEQIFSKYLGVHNICWKDSTNGVVYITNVRVVWISLGDESLNCTIPWICIKSITTKDTSSGPCINVELWTKDESQSIAFITDKKLFDKIYLEMHNIFKTYSVNPIFGIATSFEDEQKEKIVIPRVDEDVEIIDKDKLQIDRPHLVQRKDKEFEIDYNKRIGLSIEKLPQGITLEQLWKLN
jgi:Bardet-Biedl syndrome 5 protein